jgi:NifU-like protein involved in Fe-S cluster formation
MDYSSEVRERFAAPVRAGDILLDTADAFEGVAEDRSLSVWIRFQIQLRGTRIECVRFRAYGCPHTLAAADRIAGMLEGEPVESIARLDLQGLAEELAVPREKFGKLLRLEDAMMACLAAAEQRKD